MVGKINHIDNRAAGGNALKEFRVLRRTLNADTTRCRDHGSIEKIPVPKS